MPPVQLDGHFPALQPQQEAALVVPALLSLSRQGAVLQDPATKQQRTLTVGGVSAWGWELSHASVDSATAVLEYKYDDWAAIVWVKVKKAGVVRLVRKPVGSLHKIQQPVYTFEDPQYNCKQDIDPTDWLGNIAANMSESEEPSIASAIRLMAPNPDSGLLGNPEEGNKFLLVEGSALHSTPWVADKHVKESNCSGAKGSNVLWSLSDYLPSGCTLNGRGEVQNVRTGMIGGHLRAVSQGLWAEGNLSSSTSSSTRSSSSSSGGCGAEILAVSPPYNASNRATSTALLKLTVVMDSVSNTSYFKAVVDQHCSELTLLEHSTAGDDFYDALAANADRWNGFVERGARVLIPDEDARYRDTANSLLTMYMNTDRGLLPEYGGGKFWNTYNEYLPLDTLALGGALLEFGHHQEALKYLQFFFQTRVCSQPGGCIDFMQNRTGSKPHNVSTGSIIYDVFGCDSDADYGRLIALYVQAVRYSNDFAWASLLLPTIHAMTSLILDKRAAATAAFAPDNPLHGIVAGSPEHDICGAPGYFFSVNVWHVRGLLELGRLHVESGSRLTRNATLERLLIPTAEAWRSDIRAAAAFTAVHRSDGNGLFFLHPVVGSSYGLQSGEHPTPPVKGGDEASCVERATCFASMSASTPSGGSNQHTNYANFRIFSETLLAGVLDPEYELAIMNFRESHRGTILGMTRFRDGLDDMPILGYGKGSLAHDRLARFHNTLAGHSTGYLSRGTYWGTEQRQQTQAPMEVGPQRYRNDCSTGGEDCSLCMVSSIASAYWIRWLLVSENADEDILYLARGAPRRWYQQPQAFGIVAGPTRFGRVNYTIAQHHQTTQSATRNVFDPAARGGDSIRDDQQGDVGLSGSVSLQLREGAPVPLVAIHLRAADGAKPLGGKLSITSDGAGTALVAWHAANETALIRLGKGETAFNFTCA
jgi:hypothetical protein